MKTFVFPGQGSQTKGMGGALFDEFRQLTARANDILGYSIKALCLDDPAGELNQTQYTQPAIYVVNALSYYKKLEEGAGRPDFVAGHSLGEYNALLAAGAFDFETGLKLVKERGLLMSRMSGGAMAAILGLGADDVKNVLEENGLYGVDIANYNTPSQIVISGLKDDLIRAESCFQAQGAHYVPLNTSGAFHSRYMQQVANRFRMFLSEFTYAELTIPVISNVSARPYRQHDMIDTLSRQISYPVSWSESIRYLMGLGEMAFEEVGNGVVLTKLIQRIKKEATPLVTGGEETGDPVPASTKVTAFSGAGRHVETARSAHRRAEGSPELVFMYSGQGSHYYQMGRELYSRQGVFRETMDRCDSILQPYLKKSLIDVIYDESKRYEPFDHILYTHPAIFCVQYSLTQVLGERGIRPDSVLGYSLGEYVAAVVAGMLSLEDGLKLVVQQAGYLDEKCNGGGMLVVLDQVSGFENNRALFEGCTLAGINYENNFVVSGSKARLEAVNAQLEAKSVYSQLLAVNHAFHSELIDPVRADFERAVATISLAQARVPVYSAARVGNVVEPDRQYFWDVARAKIQFKALVSGITKQREALFVDLSPTGTLANFIKYGFEKSVPSFFAMNQFGQDLKTLDNLIHDLRDYKLAV